MSIAELPAPTPADSESVPAPLPEVADDHSPVMVPPHRRMSRIPRWLAPVGVGAIAAGACVYTALNDPNTHSSFLPTCYFRQLTGLDCPGCGLTRSAYAIMQGDPLRAIDHNILAIIVFPVLIYAYLAWTASTFGWNLPQLKIKPWMSWTATAVVLSWWVIRNLPGPFEFFDSRA